tara:strand:+ start:1328 stop:1747 length:420 start_codon:yes stop_codon:yes gene_type:complete
MKPRWKHTDGEYCEYLGSRPWDGMWVDVYELRVPCRPGKIVWIARYSDEEDEYLSTSNHTYSTTFLDMHHDDVRATMQRYVEAYGDVEEPEPRESDAIEIIEAAIDGEEWALKLYEQSEPKFKTPADVSAALWAATRET